MDTLSPEEAAGLLRRQDDLHAEARAIVAELDLARVLAVAGTPVRIGSSVLGLMVWRDIDFNVVSPGLNVAQVYEIMLPLLTDPRVTRARYLNGSGPFNETGLPRDERYYFALTYRTGPQIEWKIDVSFWLVDGPRDETAQRYGPTRENRRT